uniref:LIM and SH3 protein 1 n=1 Tax=Callorhinchus milii TaxID=7868 RepID=A0A4W3H215_CALMI
MLFHVEGPVFRLGFDGTFDPNHLLPFLVQIKYHEEFEKSKRSTGAADGQRRDSQDGAPYGGAQDFQQPSEGYRAVQQSPAPAAQQQQHHHPPQSYGNTEPPPSSAPRAAPPSGKRYRAVYDYVAADEDEVSFQDGDLIVDVQQIDEGWMFGTVERSGERGMLPANYVEAM